VRVLMLSLDRAGCHWLADGLENGKAPFDVTDEAQLPALRVVIDALEDHYEGPTPVPPLAPEEPEDRQKLQAWQELRLRVLQAARDQRAALERSRPPTDGPEPPSWLRWHSNRHHLTPRQWQLLAYLWPHDRAEAEAAAQAVWGDEGEATLESTLRALLSDLDKRLADIGVPWQYHLRAGYIIRE
jgi:hypothetical protein